MRLLKQLGLLAFLTTAFCLTSQGNVFACGGEGEATCKHTKATYHGKQGCKGGSFNGLNGKCYKCPSGYKHRPLFARTDKNVCFKAATYTHKGKKGHSCLKPGGFGPHKGKCYKCPKGYRHDVTKGYGSSKICYKKHGPWKSLPKFHNDYYCKSGQFGDPRKGGECWSCPSGYRRSAAPVTSDNACVAKMANRCKGNRIVYRGRCYTKGKCGTEGARACTIGEKFPSCGPGLYEAHGRCLKVPPGSNPISASIGSWAHDVSQVDDDCRDFWTASPPIKGSKAAKDTVQCMKYLDAGYYCAPLAAAKDTLDIVANLANLPTTASGNAKRIRDKIHHEYSHDPCKNIKVPFMDFRSECAVGKTLYDESTMAIRCLTKAQNKGYLNELIPGLEGSCELAGDAIFNLEVAMIGGEVLEAAKAAASTSKLAALVVKLQKSANRMSKVAKKASSLEEKLRTIDECRALEH
jgi:hypothetical protein